MKISLCAIVKNDALVLGRMLESAIGVVDEIVITDTGSTDSTSTVISEFQETHPSLLKYVHFDWIDDFSAARNFSLSQASGDWILVVDADEFLDEKEKLQLRSFLEQTSADGIFVKQRNYTGSMKNLNNVSDIDVCRLFRKGHQYEGAIHEQIAGNITKAGGTFGSFTLHLHHIGYTQEYVNYKGKNARNINLLEYQLHEIPSRNKVERWFAESNLYAEYIGTGQWEKVSKSAPLLISEMKKVKKKDRPNFLLRVYKFYINSLSETGRIDDAIRVCKEAVQEYPTYTDLYANLADLHGTQNRFVESIKYLKQCRRMGDVKANFVEYQEGTGTYLSARKLGNCWMKLGDDLSAREWFVKSYAENTEQVGLIPWIVALTPDQDVLKEMEKTIRTPQRYKEFIQFYTYAGFDDAIEYIDKAFSKWGDQEGFRRAKFAYSVYHGKTPELPNTPAPMDFCRMGLWAYEQGRMDEATGFWKQADILGEYLIRVTHEVGTRLTWTIERIFDDLLAARATKFVTDHAAYIEDLSTIFLMLEHTPLIAALTNDDYLESTAKSTEEWEWRAQVYFAKGNRAKAKDMLEFALLPSGELSIKGSLISADMNEQTAEEIIRKARKLYPESKTLSYIWMSQYAPSKIPAGLVM